MRIIGLFIVFILFSCKQEPAGRIVDVPTGGEVEKAILEVNKYLTKKNQDHIRGFIHRTGWEMQKSGSGLWYQLNGEKSKPTVSSGDYLSFNYKLYLIDGTAISSSEVDGLLSFTAGQGGVESGLEEAALMMSKGMSAKLILPPHLAYGNFGSPEKGIPQDAILIYELELVNIR